MRMLFLTLLLLPILSACDVPTRTEYIVLEIPAETLNPCPLSDRSVKTLRELSALATEHRNTAICNAGKLGTISDIQVDALAKAAENNGA